MDAAVTGTPKMIRQRPVRLVAPQYASHAVCTRRRARLETVSTLRHHDGTMRQKQSARPWEKIGISRATWYRHGKPTEKRETAVGRPPLGKVAMTGAERVR